MKGTLIQISAILDGKMLRRVICKRRNEKINSLKFRWIILFFGNLDVLKIEKQANGDNSCSLKSPEHEESIGGTFSHSSQMWN